MRAMLDRWLRAIVARGPESRDYFESVRDRYAALWREGRIDGPEMQKLLDEFCAWLRMTGLDAEQAQEAEALRQSECWRLIRERLKGIDCDPQAVALMQLFSACGGASPTPGATSA
jgi:hypothetical protein